jgi:hypothetical protein
MVRNVLRTHSKDYRAHPLRGVVFGTLCALATLSAFAAGAARAEGKGVIEFRYTPVTRAQIAIWVEDASGKFMATVALSESVAFRGIGNRPGASQMNSGYRWPYGRREGVLPIWAHRRANAPGAKMFPRVIFQNRIEGFASQTTSDQSADSYYCLQFDTKLSTKDELDAVTCATKFNSDKGRYMTQADVDKQYGEPWQELDASGVAVGSKRAMPLKSVYPPRMDTSKCAVEGACFDGNDVSRFADDARAVMPDIDAVSKATAPGDMLQKVLFSLPGNWAKGDYVAWIEVNVEGDYNEDQAAPGARMMGWNSATYPTSLTPDESWDYYAKSYGYPYRGQPSLAYKIPFTLGAVGESMGSADVPVGRSSWDFWAPDYGKLEPITFGATDAKHMSDQNGSGADRLRRDVNGHRMLITTRVLSEFPETAPTTTPGDEPGTPTTDPTKDPTQPSNPDGGVSGHAGEEGGETAGSSEGSAGESAPQAGSSGGSKGSTVGVVIEETDDTNGEIGPIEDLSLRPHPNKLRAFAWILMRFRAARSDNPLHEYEVRVATEPIVDDASFLRFGRPARNATDDTEGATALMLPTDVPAGKFIDVAVGDLVADTHYYVAVRATDELNRHGPISVAEINTPRRTFATVTACFVATAAYGTPMAAEITALRRFRDRYLSATAPGRALVEAYQTFGPRAARVIARHESLRGVVRALLTPVIAITRALP